MSGVYSSSSLADETGYNDLYKGRVVNYPGDARYKINSLTPFSKGGRNFRARARGLAVSMLMSKAKPGATILDAGCGLGTLSIYLSRKGFNVLGVDISREGCEAAQREAAKWNAPCKFLGESLESTSIPESSVDFVIGFDSLHHFIKYDVPPEFLRVLKPGAEGFFADGFAENRLYRIFHDKETMARMGDVLLNRGLIKDYFRDFNVEIIPTDWFGMLDKLYRLILPAAVVRPLSKMHAAVDRLPLPLGLAGVVVTHIAKPA